MFRNLPNVSVVIPTCGNSSRLDHCLESLSGQYLKPFEVMVVSSTANQLYRFGSHSPAVKTVTCPHPASFSRAVNCGINATSGAWVFVLNDDVVLRPSFIKHLLGNLPDDQKIGMICGKLLSADGRTLDSTGQFVSRSRTARERGHRSVDRGQFNKPGYVFSVPGAAALYRRDMLEAIAEQGKYFDEEMGMYLEDLDLGWRAEHAGWRAYYVPEALGFHARGASAKTRSPRWRWLGRYYLPWLSPELQARYILNRYRLILNNDSVMTFVRDLPWIVWYELRLWAYLVGFERKTLRLVWQALRNGH